MRLPSGPALLSILLAFNAGFVDTTSFLGLAGLFTAHVTGNFVTLGAALISGSHGIIGKLLALPEFVAVIALARLAGNIMRKRELPLLRIFLVTEALFLFAFFALAVGFGPFPNADSPIGLLTGFAGIAAMALQNAVHRVHLGAIPPSTIMTGTTTQATLDAVDLLVGGDTAQVPATRARFFKLLISLLSFAVGCAAGALAYWKIGFWCLAAAVIVGAVAALVRLEN